MHQLAPKHEQPSLRTSHAWREPLAFIRDHRAAFVVFVLASCIVGLIGVWLPLALPIFRSDRYLEAELQKLLWDGSLYLFTIPFLTAMLGSVFASLVEDREQAARELIIVAISCVALGVLLALVFLCLQLAARSPSTPAPAIGPKDGIQLMFFALSLLAGFYLYCLPNYGRRPFPYAQAEDEKIKRVVDSAHQVSADDGMNLQGKQNG